MISDRVQREENTGLSSQADFEGDYIVDRTESGHWRIYHDGSGYSGTSGATIAKGKVLRDENGRIRNFVSQEEATDTAWILTRARQAHRKTILKGVAMAQKLGCMNTHPGGADAVLQVRVSGHRKFALCQVCALALSSDLQEACDGTDPKSTGEVKVELVSREG